MAGQRNSYGKRSHSQLDYDGGSGGGGNKCRNPGEEREQFIIEAEDTVYRYLCPVKKIGSIIGRGGEIVKQLLVDTKSKIRIGETVPGSDAADEGIATASAATGAGDSGFLQDHDDLWSSMRPSSAAVKRSSGVPRVSQSKAI